MRHYAHYAVIPFVICMNFSSLAHARCYPQTFVRYDYPVQRLDEALQELAHHSGCFIHVTPEAMQNRYAASLHGRYRPLTALRRLLRHNKGLKAEINSEGLLIRDTQHRT